MTIAGVPTDVLRSSDLTWDSLANKPLVFPPSTHAHSASDITSGTLSDNRLSSSIPRLNAANVGTLSADGMGTHRFGPGSISTVEMTAGVVRAFSGGGAWTQMTGLGLRSSGLLYLDAGASSGILVRCNAANQNAVQFAADGSSTFYGPMGWSGTNIVISTTLNDAAISGHVNTLYGSWIGTVFVGQRSHGMTYGAGGELELQVSAIKRVTIGNDYVTKFYNSVGVATAEVNGATGSVALGSLACGGAITANTLNVDDATSTIVKLKVAGVDKFSFFTYGAYFGLYDYITGAEVFRANKTDGLTVYGAITASGNGTLGFSQSRFQQSAAQTLQTQCYDTSLAAWQESTRQAASASGALVSLWGGTPALKPPAYTFTNVTTRRAINCDASSVDELADVIATLYNDIKCLMGV